MKLLSKGRASLVALVAGGVLALFAPPARASKLEVDLPGAMTIHDDAGIFSADAKRSAQDKMGAAKFNRGLHFTVDTHKSAPADIQAKLKNGDKDKVMKDWAKSLAVGDRAKGPYVLICMSPGYTEVILDEETLNRGFTQANTAELHRIFNSALLESAKKPAAERMGVRDAALLRATDYVINDLRGTKVVHTDGTPLNNGTAATPAAKKTGMSIGGWICLGLVVLLAIWLVVGIIRALTSPSYGGGYGGGPGYGGGGGGFGFGTALLGGMFGAMAGMYMYNAMMGTHYPPQAFGGEASAADSYGGSDTGDTGAGDYDDGASAGGGGDYGGDDGGGGGGGGDYGGGGGGDYGGGGGDYGGGGGGGGDYGGGGDFGGGDYGGGGDF